MAKEYGPLTLPKSGKVIYFREPVGADRLEVLKENEIGAEDAVSGSTLVSLYLSAKCITKVDEKSSVGDYKHILDTWPNGDLDYYQSIFNRMFTINQDTLDSLDRTVDFLLNGSGSTVGITSTT